MSTVRKHVTGSLDQKAIQPIVSGRRSNLIRGTISHNSYYPNSNYPNYSNWGINSAPKGPHQLQTASTYDRLSLPYRPVCTPEVRQPMAAMDDNNNAFTSRSAYDSRGYQTISNNYYYGTSLYDNNAFYRNLNPPFTFDAFPNPQELFPQTRHMNNTYTGNYGSSTIIAPTIPHTVKREVVEKKFLNLVKTVSASDNNWNFNQPLNMFSSRNMASTAADDNLKYTFAGNKIQKLVHNVSGNNFSSHSKVLPSPKAHNAKTSQSDKSGRNEDRNVPENANSREEDDDLIFLGVVDKNDVKKDDIVEVITISDDEEDGIEGDENKEKFQGELRTVKLEGGGRYGEDFKTWPKFHHHVVDSTRRVILRKETRNYHFYK